MANFVYFIGDSQTREIAIIDPAWQIDTLLKACEKEDLKIKGALITHGHFDHCNGLEELLSKIDVPVYAQKSESEFVRSLGSHHGLFGSFPKDNLKTVQSGETVSIGAVSITFVHTPGHTPGSQCFLTEDHLLTGDTLFIRGCGRCDLPGGDARLLYESLTTKIAKLPAQTILLPGHNYSEQSSSKISEEKIKNPYLLCDSYETFLTLVQR